MKEMIRKGITISLGIIGFSFGAIAQQITSYNSVYMNPYVYNASQVGLHGNEVILMHRNQWLGIEGAPENYLINSAWKIPNSRSGIGIQLGVDHAGVIRKNFGKFNYAYHLDLNDEHKLSLGVGVGYQSIGIDFNRINALQGDDPIVTTYNQRSSQFDADFGLTYRYKKLNVQAAILQLLGNGLGNFENNELQFELVRHYFTSVGYEFQLKKFKCTPIIQAMLVDGLNIKPEAIVKFDFNNAFWAAGHYRWNRAAGVSVGFQIDKTFTVGYAGTVALNELVTQNAGTHEILLGIKLGGLFDNRAKPNKADQKSQRSEYEERMAYVQQENQQLKEEQERLRKKVAELENAEEKLNYEDVKRMIEEARKEKVEPVESNKDPELKMNSLVGKSVQVQFELGTDVIQEKSLLVLDEIAQTLLQNPEINIAIEGHTDNSGDPNSNQKLSEKRANIVKTYIVSKGVSENRLEALGFGSTRPISSNESKEGRNQNRRVEIRYKL